MRTGSIPPQPDRVRASGPGSFPQTRGLRANERGNSCISQPVFVQEVILAPEFHERSAAGSDQIGLR